MADITNIIPMRRRKPLDGDLPRWSLRGWILYEIEVFATGMSKDVPQSPLPPPHDYRAGWLDALVCTLADAGMPFETWKDELSAEALAGLERLRIDLHPDQE